MKVHQKLVLGLSVLLLAGCSTLPVQQHARAEFDQVYISQVEAAAKKSISNPRIYWLNPPMKKESEQQ